MGVERSAVGERPAFVQPACNGCGRCFRRGVRVFKGRAIDRRCHEARSLMRARTKVEARGNQPQASGGLPNVIPAR